MRQIVFASKNPKKVEEIKRMAIASGKVEILSLDEVPEVAKLPQVEETGNSFWENAKIKATYWAEKLGMPVIAEDSGLEIDALGGYPGVNTKRCIAELIPGSDVKIDNPSELYPLLLDLMNKSGNTSTKASFVCTIVLVDKKGTTSVQSYMYGNMCPCAGKREFGFDQYFRPLGYDCTLSELSPSQKDSISPRSRSFKIILGQI